MRAKEQSRLRAKALASVVLPIPGTSSNSTCPSTSSATNMNSVTSALPMITWDTFPWIACENSAKFIETPYHPRCYPAGVSKSWGSERRLSSKAYRNQASGSTDNPLGLDTSLRSYSAGAGLGLFSTLPQLLYAPLSGSCAIWYMFFRHCQHGRDPISISDVK